MKQGLLQLGASMAILALCACSSGKGNKAQSRGAITDYTSCFLPKDQGQGSLKGSWGSSPIPLVIDRDFYATDNGEAMTPIRGAINTWNGWAVLKGITVFSIANDAGDATGGRDIPETTDCSQATISSSVTDAVGIWKIRSGGPGRNRRDSCGSSTGGKLIADGVQGITDWVTAGGKITGASVILNFEGFNTPGKDVLDLESLVLHELGHVLGLLHSCNGGGGDSTSSPGCFSSSVSSSYLSAVMFPFLKVAQVRRSLNQNDINRANCLYP